jgi:replicative DNA helicase
MSDYAPMLANDSERQLLGSLMLDPTMVDVVGHLVDPEDFHDAENGRLFMALCTLHEAGKPIADWAVLKFELPKFGVAENVADIASIGKLMHEAVHAGNSRFHADEIRYAAQKRRLKDISDELLRRAVNKQTDPSEDLAFIDAQLGKMRNEAVNGARLIADIADEVLAELHEAATTTKQPGIMSGVLPLDSAMGPIMPGELAILAARPGCGKTSLAMQITQHVAERQKSVLFVSLEMRDRELVRRVLSQVGGVDSQSLRGNSPTSDELSKMHDARSMLEGQPLRIWAPARATTSQIRGVAKHMKATDSLRLIVVDYIGLIKPTTEDRKLPRYEQVTAFTGALKAMAKELDVPVIALCQLNREADGMEPKLSHLRESGSIEQDADIVLFVHHPPNASRQGNAIMADIIIAKHRHGATGKVQVFWHPSECRFAGQQEWSFT